MKGLCVSVLLVMTVCLPVSAQITDPNAPFTSICTTEESDGFGAEGVAEHNRFTGKAYLVEKLVPEELREGDDLPRSGDCTREFAELGGSDSSYGCYNHRRFEDEFLNRRSQVCLENWGSGPASRVLRTVVCPVPSKSRQTPPEAMTFSPEGGFRRLHMNPENVPKDVRGTQLWKYVVIEVGNCAVISK